MCGRGESFRRTNLAALAAGLALAAGAVEPVDWVNPEIGNISHMLVPTFPTTQLPNGLYRFCSPGRSFADDRIPPLPLFIPAHRVGGLFTVHPAAESEAFAPWRGTWDKRHGLPYLSTFAFDGEDVAVRLAPTAKGAVATFDFGDAERRTLVFAPTSAAGAFSATEAVVRGTDRTGTLPIHFYGAFDPAPSRIETKGNRLAVTFDGKTVVLRFAVSTLYRVYERMVNCTEDGRYVGYDRKVHETGGIDYYNDDWTWDTYRAAHPLMCLLEPTAQRAKLTSYLRMARENPEGWVPLFPRLDGDCHGMNGFHPPALFLDAWRKGVTGVEGRFRGARAHRTHVQPPRLEPRAAFPARRLS